jgi:hypothetical protein
METNPIYHIAIPLEGWLLDYTWTHTSGVSIHITHTAVHRKVTTELVVAVLAAVEALDSSLLGPLQRRI